MLPQTLVKIVYENNDFNSENRKESSEKTKSLSREQHKEEAPSIYDGGGFDGSSSHSRLGRDIKVIGKISSKGALN